jgi:hypothetical protein
MPSAAQLALDAFRSETGCLHRRIAALGVGLPV